MVDIVLKPLKSLPFNQAILNQFKLSKIFLNLESILVANQKFLVDLESWQTGEASLSFGAICTNHMANFECYRKYLMDQKEAQKLHVKEVKSNPRYKRFLTTAKEHPGFRRRSLQDILVEPVQRIGRYTMMLKEILKHTNPETQEYEDLTNACTISSRIATMKDDVPTRLATMSLSLYTSIKDSPPAPFFGSPPGCSRNPQGHKQTFPISHLFLVH
ncbi:Dbl homology domain-containing protein [Phycomyces nitens]|nr:Dbl homology domain-containing protein [Phycomyces nitens]